MEADCSERAEAGGPPSLALRGTPGRQGSRRTSWWKGKTLDVPQALWTPSNLMSRIVQQLRPVADPSLVRPTQNQPPLGSFRKWVQVAGTDAVCAVSELHGDPLGSLPLSQWSEGTDEQLVHTGKHMPTCLGHWTPRNVIEAADLRNFKGLISHLLICMRLSQVSRTVAAPAYHIQIGLVPPPSHWASLMSCQMEE